MARRPQPAWWTYKEQMDLFCHGDALWEPAPTNYTRIMIGDVGFIREGQFHLLFSASCPLGERQLGEDVPATFEELAVGPPVFRQPRPPGCLRTNSVREIGAVFDAAVSTTMPLEAGASFSFELTGNRGAALVTKYPTYREGTLLQSAFEKYTKRHYDSWVAFASHKQYGDDVRPVLVSGFDMTRDFAMAAYSNEDASLESDFTVYVPTLASASASVWGTWRARCSPHTNHGPQECSPPPRERATDLPSSQQANARSAPDGFNQCVFIRYYTIRRRKWMFPKVIQAGAGPHNLGSGDNRGDTFPELTVQPDVELTTSSDEDFRQWDPTTDDAGFEPDIVVHNTPYDEDYDSWGDVADYVFQNSDAVSALMHHQDLVGVRVKGDTDNLPALLAKHRPCIVVDADGVGRIVCQETQQSRAPTPAGLNIGMSTGIRVSQDSPLIAFEDLAKLGVDPQLIPFVVSTILRFEQSSDGSSQISPIEAENLVEILDQVISSSMANSSLKKTCLRIIRKVSSAHCALPRSYFLPGVTVSDNIPFASGGFADIWRGDQDGEQVCVKAFRFQTAKNMDKVRQRFYREIAGWKYVSHPNVLPFLGVSETLFPLCIISPWLSNGNITEYIRTHPKANRLQLLAQVACGLEYLHSKNIVHSNITPGNILITEEGNACLGDFGIAKIITDPFAVGRDSTTTAKLGAIHYMAPELLSPPQFGLKHTNHSKESDVFSFAMITYEVLSGVLPYGAGPEAVIALQIASGNRPPRPNSPTANRWLPDPIWHVLQDCWAQTPQCRSPIGLLHQVIVKLDPERKGNIQVMENDTAIGPPEPLQSRKQMAQSVQPPTKSYHEEATLRTDKAGSPAQLLPVIRNPFREAMTMVSHVLRQRRR